MRNFKIHTTLGVCPTAAMDKKIASIILTRGADGNLSFDLKNKAYTFSQIEQCIFILKQPSGNVLKFEMYETFGAKDKMNAMFEHVYGYNYDYINLGLEAIDTANLELTGRSVTEFEVVIMIDGDDNSALKNMHTIIESQAHVGVIDSLYGQILSK